MAKKKLRKGESEEEDEFAPPPFDERAFYAGELELAKGSLLSAVWGILVALLSTAAFAIGGQFYLGLAVGILAALALRPMIERLRIFTKKPEGMKWPGMFFSYFMCWLAFWILLVNPPIMDLSPPQLRDRTPKYQEMGGSLRLSIEVMENSGIGSLSAELVLPGGAIDRREDFTEAGSRLHQLELNYTQTGMYGYHVRVEDGTGRSASLEGQTEIVPSLPPSIGLIAIVNGSNLTVDTPIYFNVTDNALISGVYYTLDNDTEKVFLKPLKKYEGWVSDNVRSNVYRIMPNASGHRWSQGAHNVALVAEDGAGNRASSTYAFNIV